LIYSLICTGLLCCAAAMAQQTTGPSTPAQSAPTKSQLMKDCIDKVKASESGKSMEDMRKMCRDVTKTEKQNQDRALVDQPVNVPAN
jgi:hypothetical protein